ERGEAGPLREGVRERRRELRSRRRLRFRHPDDLEMDWKTPFIEKGVGFAPRRRDERDHHGAVRESRIAFPDSRKTRGSERSRGFRPSLRGFGEPDGSGG